MITEEQFFLKILSDFLHNQPTQSPFIPLDWNRICMLAKAQQVEGILFTQCRSFIPPSHFSHLAQGYSKTIFYYANRAALLEEITSILKDESIPYFLVKGFTVAKLYPVPALRTMGDIDLVVHKDDKEHVHNLLLNLGFECHSQYNREWQYFKNKMEIELHHHLLYDKAATFHNRGKFINNCWDYVHTNELDWNFHFIFLLLHLHTHIMVSGAGFRQFMDLAIVIQQIHTLDWEWIYTNLANLGLDKAAKTWFGLIAVWFNIQAPEAIQLSDNQIHTVTEKVLANGVFGSHDEENINSHTFYAMYNEKYPKLKMLQRTVRTFFPSYDTIYHVDRYSFVYGKKWLMPAVWIYRAFWGLNNDGIRRLRKLLKSSLVSSKEFKKREQVLENFGIKEEKK